MKQFWAKIASFCLMVFTATSFMHGKLESQFDNFIFTFSGMYKPEMFFGKNISLLNNNNEGNKIWFQRHTLDLQLDIDYGCQTYGYNVLAMRFNVRNKGIWGNPESIASTTEAETKIVDSVGRRHKHAIPRHIFWMREAWLSFDIAQVMGLSFLNNHTFKVGLFPFQLGRGIALGDAYAVGPEQLGFYSDSFVDQYAPGALFHGEILANRLGYDLYVAILQNRSSSLSETGAAILGQQYGRLETPQRGSGIINFLIATRFNWHVFVSDIYGKLRVEPYVLYNRDPEQRIEFRGDSSSQLGTIGLAMEYEHPRFQIGFDYALNLGQQRAKGWDRNQIVEQNRGGQVVLVNSHVVDQNNEKIPFISNSKAQGIINCSFQDESENGENIGTVDSGVGYLTGPITLKNVANRFRNPYTNKYEGWMFVIDAGYWIYKKDLMLATTAFIATGDRNPNEETLDMVYSGFVPLQEAYSGKLVKSAYFLGGAGKITRPLSQPVSNQAPSRFAQTVNGFTNLVGTGLGLQWKPSGWKKTFAFNPNALAYWQENPTKKFDARTSSELDSLANTFLGVELNLFMSCMVLKDLKLFFVGSVFFPGAHYRDILGKPLTPTQQRLLDRLDRTGFDEDRIPNIGDDTSYTFNLGLEFRF